MELQYRQVVGVGSCSALSFVNPPDTNVPGRNKVTDMTNATGFEELHATGEATPTWPAAEMEASVAKVADTEALRDAHTYWSSIQGNLLPTEVNEAKSRVWELYDRVATRWSEIDPRDFLDLIGREWLPELGIKFDKTPF